MADYIYMMETRLTPEQQRGVALVQELARAQEMNLYLTGGAIRDMVSGFPIRDLDFTVQGNPFKLQKELEKAGTVVQSADEDLRSLYVSLPGNVRAEISMARSEKYDKPGKPPEIAAGTIIDDLRRRDFTVNAMALSLNLGSRGLLLDPTNGAADIENKVIRILHNYSFLEEPSRLIRATRFTARFHWPLEERTQARYNAAKEGNYIEYVSDRFVGYEIEQVPYEEDPLHILRMYDKEGWLKVLNPHWSLAKVDTASLGQLLKLRAQFSDLGYSLETAPAVMYFLTARMSDKDVAHMQRLIPHKNFVQAWRNLEHEAKALEHRLSGKEAATPSMAWKLLSTSRPETIIFVELSTRRQAVSQKIKNYLGKWRQMKDKLPLPEMAELHITPDLPAYKQLSEQAFLLLLDGKLRSRTETLKFLRPYAPPPPPPPPPPAAKRGRGKAAEAAAVPTSAPGEAGKRKGKGKAVAAVAAAVAPAPKPVEPPKPAVKAPSEPAKKAGARKPAAKKSAAKKPARPKPKPKAKAATKKAKKRR